MFFLSGVQSPFEIYFPQIKFPDFNEEEFEKAIDIYNQRDRRFGGNTK